MKALWYFLKHQSRSILLAVGVFVAIGAFFSLRSQAEQNNLERIQAIEKATHQIIENQDENTKRLISLLEESGRNSRALDCLLSLHVEGNVPIPSEQIEGCRRQAALDQGQSAQQADREATGQSNSRPSPQPNPRPTPSQDQGLVPDDFPILGAL